MYNKHETVIVYLAMNTQKDETYQRDSRSMIEKSLDLLYENYNNNFKHTIIIFYDNKHPFLEQDQIDIKKGRNEIQFHLLNGELWCPPDCSEIHNNPHLQNWNCPQFSIGYRNMMRWYGCLIYKYLFNLGYKWYMRMDDDSFIHSKIDYDLFQFMYENNYEYGFRCYSNDHINVSTGLLEFCLDYCNKNSITPGFINRFTQYNNSITTNQYNILGYYNNFSITNLEFWMRKDVQDFLYSIDQTGYQYTRRWGDLLVQSVTVQLFMNRKKLYQFNDWTYEHTTFANGYGYDRMFDVGGLLPKINDSKIVYTGIVQYWKERYGKYHKCIFNTLNVKECLTICNDKKISQGLPINNDFKPFDNDDVYYLGTYSDIEDIYLAIHDHWINCNTGVYRWIQFTYTSPKMFIWYNNDTIHNNRLYVINNLDICENTNEQTTAFFVSKELIITNNTEIQ
jgi:alpha 1,2-mannosyltransferase